jgi:hypothetical protein
VLGRRWWFVIVCGHVYLFLFLILIDLNL